MSTNSRINGFKFIVHWSQKCHQKEKKRQKKEFCVKRSTTMIAHIHIKNKSNRILIANMFVAVKICIVWSIRDIIRNSVKPLHLLTVKWTPRIMLSKDSLLDLLCAGHFLLSFRHISQSIRNQPFLQFLSRVEIWNIMPWLALYQNCKYVTGDQDYLWFWNWGTNKRKLWTNEGRWRIFLYLIQYYNKLPVRPRPQLDLILSFWHTFLPRIVRVGVWCPWTAPLPEILDQTLLV